MTVSGLTSYSTEFTFSCDMNIAKWNRRVIDFSRIKFLKLAVHKINFLLHALNGRICELLVSYECKCSSLLHFMVLVQNYPFEMPVTPEIVLDVA